MMIDGDIVAAVKIQIAVATDHHERQIQNRRLPAAKHIADSCYATVQRRNVSPFEPANCNEARAGPDCK